jgi:hypothetical protein
VDDLLFSIILSKLATELGFARATETVDNKALLRVAVLLRCRNVKHVFEVFQLGIPASEDATDVLREIEMLVKGYRG